ncbi:Sap-like sulfolipid-1-addressing protein [Promicromonospora sp. AC04]|nr:Sap-like sulfolipid-1-addressing protein [Promicromonospora sp. AC04]
MITHMVDVVGDLLPYAVGVALSPVPLIAVFLVLGAPAGKAAGTALVAARVVTVAGVATIVALLADLLPESNGTSPIGLLLRIVLGAVLMVWAVVQIVRRPDRNESSDQPAWMATMGNASVLQAARIGVVLSTVNVKELAFGAGAGLTIAAADLGAGATVAAAAGYAVIACLATIAVVVAFWFAEDRVTGPLDQTRVWLGRNSTVLVALVLLVIGAILVGESLNDL